MTQAEYIAELAKAAGVEPSKIECVDCSCIDNEPDAELLGRLAEKFDCWMDGGFEWALQGSKA